MADCAFPRCESPAETDRETCTTHHDVHVSSTGSWVDDNHREGGHG